MDIGQDRHTDLAAHVVENAQALVDARTAKRLARTAVGLVERRLVNEGHAERRGDGLELTGSVNGQLARLDRARPGNQEEGTIETSFESAQFHVIGLKAGSPT
jgi:hypothetical protein